MVVLIIRLFGVYIGAPHFGKQPYLAGGLKHCPPQAGAPHTRDELDGTVHVLEGLVLASEV